jgi:glucose-6-phosphate 1-dehydrogenase
VSRELAVVAVGRRPYTDDAFRAEVRATLDDHARIRPVDVEAWESFAARIAYHRGDFGDPATYDTLGARLDALDAGRGTRGNRLFYLATQPSAFAEIVAQLGRVGLDHEGHDGSWCRIVIEKPFGRDRASAARLNRAVGRVFREQQVYRIDHYLGKETVRNLLVFRFGNGIFEPIWNRHYVEHVQITVAESLGVEGRAAFYEEAGAVRDILQNHLMQLLALVAMEPPATWAANALREEKLKVLRAIEPMRPADVPARVVRGQYGPGWLAGAPVPGYREEPDVHPESETETYVAARLTIDDWRWTGVPFYLRAGKRLPRRSTEIAVRFRSVPHSLFKGVEVDPEPNLLALRIQPDEGILLRFAAKVPGLGLDVRPVNMDFTYGSSFSVDSPDAYEALILDALLGDASLFTRADEVERAWELVTPILEAWAEAPPPDFPNYEAGTWGPAEADALLEQDGARWRRI